MPFRAQISTSGLEMPDTTIVQYAPRRLRIKQSDAAENQDALVIQHSFLSYYSLDASRLNTLGSAAKWGGEKTRRGVEICIGTMLEPGGILKKGRNFDSGDIKFQCSHGEFLARLLPICSRPATSLYPNQFIIV